MKLQIVRVFFLMLSIPFTLSVAEAAYECSYDFQQYTSHGYLADWPDLRIISACDWSSEEDAKSKAAVLANCVEEGKVVDYRSWVETSDSDIYRGVEGTCQFVKCEPVYFCAYVSW